MQTATQRIAAQIIALFVLTLLASSANATVLKFMDLPELTEHSTAVFQGQVVGQRVVSADGHLWTDTQVKVSEVIKGSLVSGKIVVLRTLGGETPTRGEKVAGMAQFSLGEDVLLFARAVGPRQYVPVGACLGKFRLYKGPQGDMRVRRDLHEAAFARFDDKGLTIIKDGVTLVEQSDMTLSSLLKTISAQLTKGGAK